MLPIALMAIGNRTWGAKEGTHMLGLFVMTIAAVMEHGTLWAPALAVTLYFFRQKGTGATWLAATRGANIGGAILRGAYVLPYGALLYLIDGKIHWLALAFPIIAIFYLLAGRFFPKVCVELAELLTGAYVGCI